jgi:hypothetical protein
MASPFAIGAEWLRQPARRSAKESAMIPRALVFSAFLSIGLAGCASTWTVDEFEAPEAGIAARSSFAWKSGDIASVRQISSQLAADVEAELRSTITDGLLRKGYVQASDPSSADMLVSYQIAGAQRFVIAEEQRIGAPLPTDVLEPGRPSPPPASATAVPEEQRVREGTLIVFADDPASRSLIWRGRITSEGRVTSRDKGRRILLEMARDIIEEFPARKRAN